MAVLLVAVPSFVHAQPCDIVGIFGATINPTVGSAQFATAVTDLNADGLRDLVFCSVGMTVLLGKPPVSQPVEFLAPLTYATPRDPRDLVVADFNADGAADVAVACLGSGVRVFRQLKDGSGNPSGAFAPAVALDVGAAWGVGAADLNRDGYLDLIVGVHSQGIVVEFGAVPDQNGDLVFARGGTFGAGGLPKGLALADFDLDGVIDVTVALEGAQISVLRGLATGGTPDGTFGAPLILPATGLTYDVAVGDLDGNGAPDIVSANYTGGAVTTFVNQGGMTFTALSWATGGAPLGVEVADLNADGISDILSAATGTPNTVSVLPGLGLDGNNLPTFGAPLLYGTGTAYNIAVGDIDGVGGLDVAGANYLQPNASVLLNTCNTGAPITLVVNVFGSGSVVVDPVLADYPPGTEVTLTAVAEPNHVFSAWGGALVSTQNPVTVVMNQSKVISANFVPQVFPLVVSISGDGAGSVTRTPDAGSYAYGTLVTLEALPELGSVFAGWGGDLAGAPNPAELLIDGPKNVTAEFQPDVQIYPEILSIGDVPLDQGGRVKIRWRASSWDRTPGDPLAFVRKYFVWREVPSRRAAAADAGPIRRTVQGDEDFFWEYVTSLPASAFPAYSYTAQTTSDSTAKGNPYTRFLIQARNADDTEWWDSTPDSGYSVDNLAPHTPLPFTAVYGPTNALHWAPSAAPDFMEFRLYRGLSAGFTPGPETFLIATVDTGHVDASGGLFFYKLMAVDSHGNASGSALVSPDSPTAVLASVAGLETRPDRIVLRWFAAGHRGVSAIVERRTDAQSWFALDTLAFDGAGYLRYEDTDVVEGLRYGYRVAIFDAGEFVPAGETWASAVSMELAFLGAWPNPSTDGRWIVRFSLPDARAARIELFDVGGRRVLLYDPGSPGPGTHDVTIGGGTPLRPGIYLMRFTAGELARTQRVAVVR